MRCKNINEDQVIEAIDMVCARIKNAEVPIFNSRDVFYQLFRNMSKKPTEEDKNLIYDIASVISRSGYPRVSGTNHKRAWFGPKENV